MNERERQPDDAGAGDPGCPEPAASGVNRADAAAFFAAADAAIESALSGDSARFNQAARQEGGQ
ncbi:MAG: hypothetical protein KJ072_20190 [Verrucomicrobia bacterium]|nr:hypothetical protein [Verrucomicrobiota bacterium]